MKTSPQWRPKLVNLNPYRTYLIKFVPSVSFSIILPKHPSSRAPWWLKRPPFNKRTLSSGPPVAKHLPCCHVPLNNNLSTHGRSVLFETEGTLPLLQTRNEELGRFWVMQQKKKTPSISAFQKQRSKANIDQMVPTTKSTKTQFFRQCYFVCVLKINQKTHQDSQWRPTHFTLLFMMPELT